MDFCSLLILQPQVETPWKKKGSSHSFTRECIFLRESDSIYYSQDWKSKSAFGFYKQFLSITRDGAKHFLCRSKFLIYFSKFTALSVAKRCLSPSLHQWRIALRIAHFTLTPVPVKLLQSCPTLSDPMDHSAPGSSIYGILQARMLEWVAISFSKQVNCAINFSTILILVYF